MRKKLIQTARLKKWVKSCVSFLMILTILTGWLSFNSTTVNASTPVEVGYRDFTYPSGTGANDSPTGEKPESKLWWNDGYWWGSLWSRSANAYTIHRLDLSNQDWVDTGVDIDNRTGSRGDALWDGNKLYVVSHLFVTTAVSASAGQRGQLYRYSYTASQNSYSLDAGFPVEVTRGKSETLVIGKDSAGTLWVTYVESGQVMINHSLNNNDASWGTPFALPAGTQTQVASDDTASIITYNNHVGVMWSNQKTPKTMFFAVHPVNAPDTNWTRARAYTISSDDHMNLKSLETDPSGNVFAVVKTSKADATIVLLVCKNNLNRCKSDTDWVSYPVYNSTYSPTRAILQIDISNRNLYIFAQAKDLSTNDRGIYYKRTSLDRIQFNASTIGTGFIKSSADNQVNDPTSSKQIANGATGIVVLASDSGSNAYLHNYIDLGGGTPPPTTTVTPTPTSATPTPEPTTATPTPTTPPGSGDPIKSITFEAGSLTDAVSGADKVVGSVTLDNGSVVKGTYAARIANTGSSYLEETFTGVNDVYISFYIKLNALPATQTRILLISNSGTTVGNLYLLTNGTIRLRNVSTTVGNSSQLALNTLYRVGIHQGADGTLDAYVAPDDQAFGSPFASMTSGAWSSAADRLRLGSTLADPIDVVIDDVMIDASAMPGPSAP